MLSLWVLIDSILISIVGRTGIEKVPPNGFQVLRDLHPDADANWFTDKLPFQIIRLHQNAWPAM